MQRALVIRTYGNINLAKPIVQNLESPELKRLRAQIGVHAPRCSQYYRKKIRQIPRKYPIHYMSPVKSKLWGLYGLIILLAREH